MSVASAVRKKTAMEKKKKKTSRSCLLECICTFDLVMAHLNKQGPADLVKGIGAIGLPLAVKRLRCILLAAFDLFLVLFLRNL